MTMPARTVADWWIALRPPRHPKPVVLDADSFEPVRIEPMPSPAELAAQGYIVCLHRMSEATMWIGSANGVVRITIAPDGSNLCWIVERDGASCRRSFELSRKSETIEQLRLQIAKTIRKAAPDATTEGQLQWERLQERRAKKTARIRAQQEAAGMSIQGE